MWMKSQWFFQAFVLSLLLNGILVGVFFYFLIRENPLPFFYTPPKIKQEKGVPPSPDFFASLRTLPLNDLFSMLKERQKVERRWAVRDFALGTLVETHEFAVWRALGKRALGGRRWKGEEESFLLFPGLDDESWEKIERFAKTEAYPWTTKGLFLRIQEAGVIDSPSEMIEAFSFTSEFVVLNTLFSRSNLPLHKGALLKLVLEGEWEMLENFFESEKKEADFSEQMRQELLVSYLDHGSQTAAYLLLLTDLEFVGEELSEEKVCQLISQLTVPTEEASQFLQEILEADYPLGAQAEARKQLGNWLQEPPEEVAKRFFPRPSEGELRPSFREAPPAAPEPSQHIVQPGESLWLIARKYHLTVEELMQANNLHSSTLKQGAVLKIPR
ncbi:MAG: hypothetical protein K940chlam9_01443 [Chlamydiae bacterium]|nr:hypothetical protein [Chlamydiota bacterium]